VLLAPTIAPSLRLDLTDNLASTVGIGALVSAGYGALRAMSDLWFSGEELKRLDGVLRGNAPPITQPASSLSARPTALVATGLEVRYGSHLALRAEDLRISLAGLVLVTGPNGAGKTTLAAAIAGILEPSAGTIAFTVGGNVVPCTQVAREHVAMVPQQPVLIETLSIRENVRLAVPAASDEDLRAALMRVGFEPSLDHPAGSLSRGQRQRVGLARTLLSNPLVLVLDEPDAWLDTEGRTLLIRVLIEESERRAIIVVSHRAELREIARCVVSISGGHTASITSSIAGMLASTEASIASP
jgi:ABC-type multidrug transport system ATPase subunit